MIHKINTNGILAMSQGKNSAVFSANPVISYDKAKYPSVKNTTRLQ